MMPAAVIALLELLAQFAPSIPEIAAAVQTAISLVRDQRDPTPEEQAAIDAGLEAAHQALQAS